MNSKTNSPVTIVLTIICVLLQLIIAPNIAIAQVVPCFLLLPVVYSGLVDGAQRGSVIGFICGLVLDLTGAGPFGGMMLVFTLTGFATGFFARNLFSDGWITPVLIFIACALIANLLDAILLAVVGVNTAFLPSLWRIVLPATLYDAVLAVICFPLVRHFMTPSKQTMRTGKYL